MEKKAIQRPESHPPSDKGKTIEQIRLGKHINKFLDTS